MNLRTKASVYGLAGLAVAGLAIIAGSFSGAFTLPSGGFNPTSPGSLSILLTDPPSVPPGVSAVYVTYGNVGIHANGLGEGGWIWTGDKGTVETMGLVNISQTISAGQVPSGRYNAIAFLISSATITFNGANYSADIDSGRLNVLIPGGLVVNTTVPAAAVIDLSPVILNLGSQTNPNFVMTTAAQALQVPHNEFMENMRHLGFKIGLANRPWFRQFVSTHFDKTAENSTTLTSSSFSVSVTGTSTNSTVKLIILSTSGQGRPQGPLATLADSFIFAVQPDGKLQLVSFPSIMPGIVSTIKSDMRTSGFPISMGATDTFTYSGPITTLFTNQGVASGTTYYLTVVGPGLISVSQVTAT